MSGASAESPLFFPHRHRDLARYESTARGRHAPVGATLYPDSVNFSVSARDPSSGELLLFDDENAPQPSRTLTLDPNVNRSYRYCQTFVPELPAGQVYAYRANGTDVNTPSDLTGWDERPPST